MYKYDAIIKENGGVKSDEKNIRNRNGLAYAVFQICKTEAQRRRWETSKFVHDHPYAVVSERDSNKPDISNCINEEIIEFDGSIVTADFTEWRAGRRVVELGVLADGLSACKKRGLPLSLQNCSNIKSYGLAAILKIVCANTACLHTNLIPTGKRRGKVWDVNSKLATAKKVSAERQRKSYPKNQESLTQKAKKALPEKQRKSYPKDSTERLRKYHPKGKESLTRKANQQNDNSNTCFHGENLK
ncbi:unnamed protein product [Mytilus coruscus]|uniref:Uncharacterized protein n=1 Tax=Mytilus coruscus TaxID=42192 RepID=A0A6J8EMU3_MYTCO|nr:unnamed protein product [Mytilus coruscus]